MDGGTAQCQHRDQSGELSLKGESKLANIAASSTEIVWWLSTSPDNLLTCSRLVDATMALIV